MDDYFVRVQEQENTTNSTHIYNSLQKSSTNFLLITSEAIDWFDFFGYLTELIDLDDWAINFLISIIESSVFC